MNLSNFFLPLLKETPNDAKVVSHQLMLKSGMIRQIASGIYVWLPLGLMALKNIENIIIQYLNEAGCNQILMSITQPTSLWAESGRFEAYGAETLRFKDRHENELLFSPTNEEVVSAIFRQNVHSYKSLPMNLYQIQWKFRDEIRPRFGVMRAREFLMKDGYSFDIDSHQARKTYDLMYKTYLKIFAKLGVKAVPLQADTGPIGGDLSHEFHVLAGSGESDIYYDPEFETMDYNNIDIEKMRKLYAMADEKHDESKAPKGVIKAKGIEVGHIFYYSTKYSKSMDFYVSGPSGEKIYPEGGCYGIGVSRLVAAIIEASYDERGIIWPISVAPFKIAIINLDPEDSLTKDIVSKICKLALEYKLEFLYDDTKESAGKKFANNDLIGTPFQILIGKKNAVNNKLEFKDRKENKWQIIELSEIETKIKDISSL